jgi:HSP20 family protein
MANIIRWDPFGEMTDLRSIMDRMFYRGFARPWRIVTWENGHEHFPVDLYETDEEVVVRASLPGVKAEEIAISVTGGALTIKAETKEEQEEEKSEYYRRERRYGTFQRVLTLPARVDSEKAEATFEDGVLDLHLPKAAEVRPKTIKVTAKGVLEGKKS